VSIQVYFEKYLKKFKIFIIFLKIIIYSSSESNSVHMRTLLLHGFCIDNERIQALSMEQSFECGQEIP